MDIVLPKAGTGPGVVLAHAWWGLNPTIRVYAAALAQEGFVVGLPDLFDGRIATSIEDAQALADTDWSPDAGARLSTAIIELAAHDTVVGERVSAVGFSYSGWFLLGLAAKAELPLDRVATYYATRPPAAPHVPVLAHFAQNDPFESEDDMAALAASLAADGPPNAAHSYAGTSHWFAEADRPEYVPDAATLAFERTVAFLRSR